MKNQVRSQFRRRLNSFAFPLVLLITSSLFLSSCEGTASGTETGNQISLRGRVIDKDNAPVSGVAVQLAKTGLGDTTDAAGRYFIRKDTAVQDPGGVLDTLIFLQAGQRVAALDVDNWVDSLPDVKLTQRDISGPLQNLPEIGKVEAVISGTGFPNPTASELFFNRPSSQYSGYVYFPPGTTNTYAVYINVYDTSGFLIGRSDTISFNGLAGDITIPSFDPLNVKLRAYAGADTALAPGDTLRLQGTGSTPPGTRITEYAWKLPGDTGFWTSPGGNASYVAPLPYDTGFIIEMRVTNDSGARAVDTVNVRVLSRMEHLFLQPWVKVADSNSVTGRTQPVILEFKGKMLKIGGYHPNDPDQTKDVWSSDDGLNWQLVIDSMPLWNLVLASGILVFHDTLWMLGGDDTRRDVWFSEDCVSWSLATDRAPYTPRSKPLAAEFNGRMFMLGGQASNGTLVRDVWSSSDGINWQLMATDPGFLLPGGYSVWGGNAWLMEFENKLWVIAFLGNWQAWTSSDGITWSNSGTLPGGITNFDGVNGFTPIIYENRLFVSLMNGALYYDPLDSLWYQTNFVNQFTTPRTQAAAIVFRSRVWMIGGTARDVWNWGW